MVTMTTTMAPAPRATTAAAASPSSRASSAPMRATNVPRARASFASFASVSAKVRARASTTTTTTTTTTTRAVDDDDDGRSRQDYVKPVQQESALLESETFSAALTAAFVVFLLAGAFFVFGQLAKPVLDVMVQSFPGGSK